EEWVARNLKSDCRRAPDRPPCDRTMYLPCSTSRVSREGALIQAAPSARSFPQLLTCPRCGKARLGVHIPTPLSNRCPPANRRSQDPTGQLTSLHLLPSRLWQPPSSRLPAR